MLVAADTGEVFIDFNGVRIRVTGSSGGGETPHGDDDDDSLLTGWAVVNAALLVSDSVPGGGPGDGVLNTPAVLLPDFDNELLTAYSITEGR